MADENERNRMRFGPNVYPIARLISRCSGCGSDNTKAGVIAGVYLVRRCT